MPSYHNRPSAPTNLTLHQAIDVNGVIIVPAYLADAVANEAVEMTACEDFVIEQVRGGQKTLGLYPPTDEANLIAFAALRKRNRR